MQVLNIQGSKTCTGSKNAKMQKIQTNQALTSDIHLGFAFFAFFEPVQVLELPGLDVFAFF